MRISTNICRLALFISILLLLAGQALPTDLQFSPAVYYVGSNPYSVFSADFDGDGDKDLVTANYGSNSVSILLNKGDATFALAVNYAVGTSPRSVCSADFDGDGDYDLAVANYYSDYISILENHGDGTFADAVNYPADGGFYGGRPWAVCSADFDGDDDYDLAVTMNLVSHNGCRILLNNGDGTFVQGSYYDLTQDMSLRVNICPADVDGDGDIDLAAADDGIYYYILRNNGYGGFSVSKGEFLRLCNSIFSADFDGDGSRDLAVAGGEAVVGLNDGSGVFPTFDLYALPAHGQSVYAADFDSDGSSDLVTACELTNNVSIRLNDGYGTFGPRLDIPVGMHPRSVISTDLDGDGDYDLAVANSGDNNVSILRNWTLVCPPCEPCPIAGDVNGDGVVDVGDVSCLARYLFSNENPCQIIE
ncbi:MAG: VCBS repeat-containing protein [Candidatus Zixiibacteriota bacterium]|nr:MAG: VCBS repeat-containing protein [candidate division Zixibacteria bacterium]